MKSNIPDKDLAKLVELVDRYLPQSKTEAGHADVGMPSQSEQIRDAIRGSLLKDTRLAQKYFKYFTEQSLSESALDHIYEMGAIISWYNKDKEKFSQIHQGVFYAIQYQFDNYLRFRIPVSLWPDLANQSWNHLRDFIDGKYKNLNDFQTQTQSHWTELIESLDSFQNHPIYGEKIKARLTGYL